MKKITQFKRENGVETQKNPTPRNPLRKSKHTKYQRRLMRLRTIRNLKK